jgi:2-hydroxy-3-keto-5-methylthiopentenyl-1-phosphate phosphatase
MCIICLEIEKNRLTIQEARRNFGEMSVSLGEHAEEVEEILSRLEIDEMLQEYLKDIEELNND